MAFNEPFRKELADERSGLRRRALSVSATRKDSLWNWESVRIEEM
jgi:hypothetical protein